MSVFRPARGGTMAALLVALVAAAGCDQEPAVRVYQATADPERGDDGMLAALLPAPGQVGWSFKVVGSYAAVQRIEPQFRALIASVGFDAAGQPQWTLPDGWLAADASEVSSSGGIERFATLHVPVDGRRLELTVVAVSLSSSDVERLLLANVNRWREQMTLPPLGNEQFRQLAEELTIDGRRGVLVKLRGHWRGSAGLPGMVAAGGPASGTASSGELTYRVPPGWKPAPPDAFSRVALEVRDGAQHVRITVSALAPEAGDLLANVNRWRGQVGLPAVGRAELEASLRHIEVAGQLAPYVEFLGPEDAGPPRALLGVILTRNDGVWFFKLIGDAPLVQREKGNFEEFVKSANFP